MSSLTFLKKQLWVYEECCRESWKPDHDDAMAVYDIEDAISFGVSLYERLKRKPPKEGTTVEMAGALCAYYRDWYKVSRDILDIVEDYEESGYVIEGADEFKQMFAELTHMQDAVSRLSETVSALESGKGIPLDDAIRSLRRACSA